MSKPDDRITRLRKRAEETMCSDRTADRDPEAATDLIEELLIYQAELDMQHAELKEAHRNQEVQLHRYTTLFEYLPIPALVLDDRGIIESVNQEAAALFGPRLSRWLGQHTLIRMVEVQDRLALSQAIKASSSERKPRVASVHLVLGGATLPVDIHLIDLPDSFGVGRHTLAMMMDRSTIQALERSEDALRAAEWKFHTMADWATDWEYWQGPNLEIVYMSPSAETVTGYPAEAFVSDPDQIDRIVHRDDLADWKEHTKIHRCQEVDDDRDETDIELRITPRQGPVRWVLHRCRPLYSAEGEYLGRRVSVRDITAHKQIECDLDEKNRTLQAVLDHMPAAVQVFDATTNRSLLANRHAERLLGRPIAVDTPLQALAPTYGIYRAGTDAHYPLSELPLMRALRGATCREEDVELRYPDGRQALVEMIAAPIRDDEAMISAAVVIFQEITARKLAQQRQELNEMRLDALLELSRQAPRMSEEEIFRAGLEDAERLTGSTIGYLHFLEKDQETIRLAYCSHATFEQCQAPKETRHQLSQAGIWADSIRLKRPLIHNDYPVAAARKGYPDGHSHGHLQRYMSAPVVKNGRVEMMVGVGNKPADYDDADLRQLQLIAGDLWEIVSRRRIELELEQAHQAAQTANRAKSAFLANMSHELRTPLNAVLGYAQILLNECDEDPSRRKALEAIRNAGDYLLTLINDILDLAKIEAGRFELQPVVCDPAQLFAQIGESFAFRAEQKGIAFHIEGLERLPAAIEVDEKRLRQVVMNLLGNAIKFTERGGIRLGLVHRDGILEVTVTDTGIGIAPEQLPHLFTPYTQVGTGHYRREGTGLGLAISRSLVQSMGGRIDVESEIKRGSRFTFQVPARTLEGRISVPSPLSRTRIVGYQRSDGRHTPLRLLVVDDRADNRMVLRGLLEPFGFAIEEAAGGEAALQQIERRPPDLVLMDLVMPDLDGLTATRRLRLRFPSLPVIAVSARAFAEDRSESTEAGCVAHISKPVRLDDLLPILARHLPLAFRRVALPAGPAPAAAGGDGAPVDLAALAPEQRRAIAEAVVLGDRDRIGRVLASIAEGHPGLAATLEGWVDDYRYQEILDLVEAARPDRPDQARRDPP